MNMEFVDAQEMHLLHSKTFDAPTKEELDNLEQMDHVKICCGDERFWVQIRLICGESITGVVDNILVHTLAHGIKNGDLVKFEKRHIYSIIKHN